MCIHKHTTYNLHVCDVFLPPHVLVAFEGGEEVIKVHDNVHKGVEHRGEVCLPARTPARGDPPQREHGGVVVQMER